MITNSQSMDKILTLLCFSKETKAIKPPIDSVVLLIAVVTRYSLSLILKNEVIHADMIHDM